MLDTSTSEWIDKQIEISGGCRREASCHFFDAAILLLRVACTLQSGPLKGKLSWFTAPTTMVYDGL